MKDLFYEGQFMLVGTYSAVTITPVVGDKMSYEFLCLFCNTEISPTENIITFIPKVENRMNGEIREKISQFIKTNIRNYPLLLSFGKWLHLVENDELFYFIPRPKDEKILDKVKRRLLRENLQGFIDNEELVEKIKTSIELNYEIKIFDERSIPIGESDKKKRKCIYCDRTGVDKFTQKAHAISESLGNKSLVQNEECDICNNFFGSQVESELAKYLQLFRCMFKVSGKSGFPQRKDLYEYFNDKFVFRGSPISQSDTILTISVDIPDKIVPQKMYKTLIKYTISLIGNDYREELVDTISWLKGGWADETVLPKIAVSCQQSLAKEHPWVQCFIRKNDDKLLPKFVIEFHFLFFVFVAIVPYVKDEETDFSQEQNYQHFWESFPHLRDSKGWVYQSWSSDQEEDLKNVLTFVKRTDHETF